MNNSGLPYDARELERKVNYHFSDRQLLKTALTHSSFSNELKSKLRRDVPCNERLEFLGDSVLSIIVSKYLFTHYQDLPEGGLTRLRAGVVCEKSLAEIAARLELGNYLYLGRGEEINGGRERGSILADAFEALLAAIFLDSGVDGEQTVAEFLMPLILEELQKVIEQGAMRDNKTLLQQIVQQVEGEILEYHLVDESGPAHSRTFEVEARLNSNIIGRGKGKSKREAEQDAAREALIYFGENN